MADPIPAPTPSPDPWWKPLVYKIVAYAFTAIIAALTARFGFPPAPVVERVEVPGPAPVWLAEPGKPCVGTEDGTTRATHGWVRDEQAIAANANPLMTTQFRDTPAGKVAMGDEDTYLWQTVRKVNNKGPPWYSNVDQKQVGCCVGCGWKHASDICLAAQIAAGAAFEWKPLSVEAIYGGSRVEIGGGKIRGDGSVGAWAAKWVSTYGVAPMEKYDSVDLTTFDPSRARDWGKSGVPADVEAVAKLHPVKSTALVRTWADVKRAIQQHFPIAVCSDQGFTMQRDATGSCRASGTWGHCMCIAGCRTLNGKEQGFILNSWGDNAHTGPVMPADAPLCGFWADAAVIDRMVSQGDSFALSELTGFPARKVPVNWFVLAQPKRPIPVLFAQELAW